MGAGDGLIWNKTLGIDGSYHFCELSHHHSRACCSHLPAPPAHLPACLPACPADTGLLGAVGTDNHAVSTDGGVSFSAEAPLPGAFSPSLPGVATTWLVALADLCKPGYRVAVVREGLANCSG